MELTVREAAVVLARSPRTVRAQLVRGDLPGFKRNGRWRIPKEALPLTERQRRALQAKAGAIRAAVEAALPSGAATTPRSRTPSIHNSAAFQVGHEILCRFRADGAAEAEPGPSVLARVERALLEVGVAVHQYDAQLKLEALNRARHLLAEAASILALAPPATAPASEVCSEWQLAIEAELLPEVARAARRADLLRAREEDRGTTRAPERAWASRRRRNRTDERSHELA